MRKPDESHEGQPRDLAPEADPKSLASSTLEAEISILKPLGERNDALTFLLGYQSSWYGPFLGAGIGALAMMALATISAVIIGINEPAPGVNVAINEPSDIEQTSLISFDIFSPSILPEAAAPLEPVRSHVRSKVTRPEIRLAAYKPRREPSPSSRPRIEKFIPTKLVIYAENGVIKKRIEPWL
jgi:hypothetical protein